MKYLAIALASAALTGAQTPAISIRPHTAAPSLGAGPTSAAPTMGVPILGYTAGPGPLELHMIVGTAKAAHLGAPIALPSGVKRMFVPPREHYLLLESKAGDPLAVWSPMSGASDGTPLPGALAYPDSVAFSARGDAAVLYSNSADQIQVVSGLPAEPTLTARPGIGKFGEAAGFAVSDDGAVIVAILADNTAIVSSLGGEWQSLPQASNARAVLFVPHTHDIVVSDTSQQTLTLVTHVTEQSQSVCLVAHHVAADRLAFTKEGAVLLAASSVQSKVWTVDLKTMTPSTASSSLIDTLLPMRDGHTFLLSAPGVALWNVPVESDSVAGFVPVTR